SAPPPARRASLKHCALPDALTSPTLALSEPLDLPAAAPLAPYCPRAQLDYVRAMHQCNSTQTISPPGRWVPGVTLRRMQSAATTEHHGPLQRFRRCHPFSVRRGHSGVSPDRGTRAMSARRPFTTATL